MTARRRNVLLMLLVLAPFAWCVVSWSWDLAFGPPRSGFDERCRPYLADQSAAVASTSWAEVGEGQGLARVPGVVTFRGSPGPDGTVMLGIDNVHDVQAIAVPAEALAADALVGASVDVVLARPAHIARMGRMMVCAVSVSP